MLLNQVAFLAVLLAALTAAFARGGPTERIGAALLLVAALISPLVEVSRFGSVELGIAVVDTALLAALLWLAFRSDHHWPAFAAAFQALAVLTHMARLAAGPLHGFVYGSMLILWSYLVVLALLAGSLLETRVGRKSPQVQDPGTPPALPHSGQKSIAADWQASTGQDDLALLTRLLKLHELGPESASLATTLLARSGSFSAAVATPPATLRAWGMDDNVTRALAFARSTTRSTLRRRLESRLSLANPQVAVDYLHAEMADLPNEQFRVLYLNARHRLIHDEVHGEGTITEAPVYPREIVKRALEVGAVYLILAHNHPSSDPTPSRSDIAATRAIADAARAIDVTVIEHVIISASGHVSMRGIGIM